MNDVAVFTDSHTPELSSHALKHWQEQGFLVLPGFFLQSDIDKFFRDFDTLWAERIANAGNVTIDLLEGPQAGQRLRLRDAPDEAMKYPHKINDLFLELDSCRHLNLNDQLCQVLCQLLDDRPMVCNSLSFRKGSQQPYHFDTYYMPPPVKDMMAVSSICLEDQSADSGPLMYYPGSHKIEPYVFSHGGIHAVEAEMPLAEAYARQQVEKLRLTPETFIGQAGDVFIWHSQLFHGGSPIQNHNKTRKSLVTHYWRRGDVDLARVVDSSAFGAYLKREHQAV